MSPRISKCICTYLLRKFCINRQPLQRTDREHLVFLLLFLIDEGGACWTWELVWQQCGSGSDPQNKNEEKCHILIRPLILPLLQMFRKTVDSQSQKHYCVKFELFEPNAKCVSVKFSFFLSFLDGLRIN